MLNSFVTDTFRKQRRTTVKAGSQSQCYDQMSGSASQTELLLVSFITGLYYLVRFYQEKKADIALAGSTPQKSPPWRHSVQPRGASCPLRWGFPPSVEWL